MALVDDVAAFRNEVHLDDRLLVDRFGLSIGIVSVGLPTACTAEAILERYLDLVKLVSRGATVTPYVAPDADVIALAGGTNLSADIVRARLTALQA